MQQLFVIGVMALFAHFVGDFVVQLYYKNGWMGREKWHNQKALVMHCITYGLVLGAFTAIPIYLITNNMSLVYSFIIVNVVSHYFIDMCTSRMNHKFVTTDESCEFVPIKIRNFPPWLIIIGFDQFLHMTIMFYMLLRLV